MASTTSTSCLLETIGGEVDRGEAVSIGIGNGWLHVGRAGPTRGPAVVTREVRRERWRLAKAPAGPADYH
jgi:hypothetical protein